MKRLTGIFFIVCLTLPFFGTFFFLLCQKHSVRSEVRAKMIAGLSREELVTLQFSRSDSETILNWEHSGEFEYAGQMYDVIRTVEHNDSIIYICWPDNEETALNQKLGELVSLALGNDPVNKECRGRLWSFYKCIFPAGTSVLTLMVDEFHPPDFHSVGTLLLSRERAVYLPPPEKSML